MRRCASSLLTLCLINVLAIQLLVWTGRLLNCCSSSWISGRPMKSVNSPKRGNPESAATGVPSARMVSRTSRMPRGDGLDDPARVVHHLRHAKQPHIRSPEQTRGGTEPRHVHRAKAGGLDQSGTERVLAR